MTGTQVDMEPTIDVSTPEFSNAEYEALRKELEKQFPAPSWEDVRPEWKWIYESTAANTFDPAHQYVGYSVGVYQQRVVAVDINYLRLVVNMSKKYQVHPDRIVVRSFPEF
ncbi:MAG TPA: hypothetical protein VLM40_16505 [Gemmata sp.]|nr:hypothetical protein [Gemmata sp.]